MGTRHRNPDRIGWKADGFLLSIEVTSMLPLLSSTFVIKMEMLITLLRSSLYVSLVFGFASACTSTQQQSTNMEDEQPDFFSYAEGSEDELSIKVALSRVDGEVRGSGRLVEDGRRTFLSVRSATLCTDPVVNQNAILQTDPEQPLGIWTPACVEVNVRVWRFPFSTKTLTLSECEPDNVEVCDLGGVDTDPRGACVAFDRDTVKWEDDFVVPGETVIFVPMFQKECRSVE